MEKLCACAVCQSSDSIWCCDVIIGGLHRIDKRTGRMKCVISPDQMYMDGYFTIRKLIYWNERILVLPTEFKRKWIAFTVDTEEITFCHPISFPYYTEEAIVVGNTLLCIPFSSDEPVLALNLDTMQYINKLDMWNKLEKPENPFEIWNASVMEDGICFLMRNSTYWCQINDKEVKTVKLEISEAVSSVDFCGSEGWALASGGKNLYKIDANGKCVDTVLMEIKQEYVRLIATQRYVFLLPKKGSGISVYDQCEHKFEVINSGRPEVNHLLLEPLYVCSYWDYIIEGKEIWFMPCRYSQLIVNLETLECRQADISYSESFSRKKYWNYCCWIQKLRQIEFKEETKDSLQGFLSMIVYSELENIKQVKSSRIWECLGEKGCL